MVLSEIRVFKLFGAPTPKIWKVSTFKIVFIGLLIYLAFGTVVSSIYMQLTECSAFLGRINILILPVLIIYPAVSILVSLASGKKGAKAVSLDSIVCIALFFTPIILNFLAHILILTNQKQLATIAQDHRFEGTAIIIIAAALYKMIKKSFAQTYTLL